MNIEVSKSGVHNPDHNSLDQKRISEKATIFSHLPDLFWEKVQNLPKQPGVYLHKDSEGKIIYVGKAKILRNRVRQYFEQFSKKDGKTQVLVRKIRDIEVIVTDSEVEALILENTLIKKHKPRYNILLKDDKTYPYICITNEQFPRIFSTRKVIRNGSRYIGPFTDTGHMYGLLKAVRDIFPIRSCDLDLTEQKIQNQRFKVCLDFHIKKCDAPCESFISREAYASYINKATSVLLGKTRALEKELEEEMLALSELCEFEKAAIIRNRLRALQEHTGKQKVLSTEPIDRDILSMARNNEDDACAVIFKVRDGKLIGKQHFYISEAELKNDDEILQSTFERFYMDSEDVPDEIFLPFELDDNDVLESWLKKKKGRKVSIVVPKIGDNVKLVNLVKANAEYLLKELEIQRIKRDQILPKVLTSLERDLRLSKPPRRIDCFDNSHFQGSETVSSMVVFVDGKPKKSEYRKYKNKTVDGIDDFASMREVITRRYSRMLEEKSEKPDLIIVDGGKGQLSAACEALQALDLFGKIPIIGLAKRLEEVFFPHESEPLLLPRTSSSLKLLQHIRDEAHRFAITFHRSLRDKRTLQTELTEIPGLGEKTAQKLLTTFGSVVSIRSASDEELQKVVGKAITLKIRTYFNIFETEESSKNLSITKESK